MESHSRSTFIQCSSVQAQPHFDRLETPRLSCFSVCQLAFLCTKRRRRASSTWWVIYMKSSDDLKTWRLREDSVPNFCRIIWLNMIINEKTLNPIKSVLVAILKEEDRTHRQLLPPSEDVCEKPLYVQPPCRVITASSDQVIICVFLPHERHLVVKSKQSEK